MCEGPSMIIGNHKANKLIEEEPLATYNSSFYNSAHKTHFVIPET